MRRLSVLAAAAALLCAAPATAAASSPSAPALLAGVARLNDDLALLGQGSSSLGSPRSPALLQLRFENSDGYAITVEAFGQTVALNVTHRHRHGKGRRRVSTTTYLAHGKVTSKSITASFGERGRIAVRFQPSGARMRASRRAGCKRSSNRVLADLGVFAGELRFQGEGGYTSAEVHRVRGRSINFLALIACLVGVTPRGDHAMLPPAKLPWGSHLPGTEADLRQMAQKVPSVPTHPSARPKSTTLLANLKLPLARTIFAAWSRGKGRARFIALDQRSEGSIGIIRFVSVAAPHSAFSVDDTLSHAVVTPPRPFSGKGSYTQGPGSTKSWTGPLAVSFLGAPHVPLTGSPFSIGLGRTF